MRCLRQNGLGQQSRERVCLIFLYISRNELGGIYMKNTYTTMGIIILLTIIMSGCGTLQGGLSFMQAEMKMSYKNYDGAIPRYQEYLIDNPDSVTARNKLGFALLKTGRLDQSIEEFNRVLKAEPGNSYAVLYLGMAYLNKEQLNDAIQIWQGFRDEGNPIVEEEIRRLLTLIQIAEARKAAEKAVKGEAALETVHTDADTITVCYFQDLSPDKSLRAFQKGLTSMVITDLYKIKSLKVVERLRLQALLEEMELGMTGIIDEGTAPRVGRLLGAETIVVGNLTQGSIQTVTSLVSASTGELQGSAANRTDAEYFYELPILIVRDIAKMKGISLTAEENKAIGQPHTKNYNAFIYYGQALDALDQGKWQDAKNFFDLALKEDPFFILARDGSASCPAAASPSIDKLQSIALPEIADNIDTAVTNAQTMQEAAAAAAAEVSGGGEGGGGGGGGAH